MSKLAGKTIGSALLLGTALLGASGLSALAQSPDRLRSDEDSGVSDEIVITGTKIRRSDFEGTLPTIELGSEQLNARGFNNLADALNELPQFGAGLTTLTTQSTASAESTIGQQFVDLFGLGSQRTLTLINGRRVVSGSPLGQNPTDEFGVQVDLNIIPVGLIERVDVISVSGAPIYGSDAVAGVVNVILKDDFEGVDLDFQYGFTDNADGGEIRARGLFGANFADGKGNAVFSLDYNFVNDLALSDRPNLIGPTFQGPSLTNPTTVFIVTEAGIPLLGDGLFDTPVTAGVPLGGQPASQFAPDGTLIPFNPGAPAGIVFAEGGDGLVLTDFQDLRQEVERFNISGSGRYQIRPGLEVFAEGLASFTQGLDPLNTPNINSNLFSDEQDVIGIPLSNPFLPASTVQSITQAALQRDLDGDGAPDNQPFLIDTNGDGIGDTPGFFLSQFTDDLQGLGEGGGAAIETNQILTYRTVVGIRGDFLLGKRNFNYDFSYIFGRTEGTSESDERVVPNFFSAVNAVALTEADLPVVPGTINAVRAGEVIAIDSSSAQVGDIICAVSLDPGANPGTPLDADDIPVLGSDGCVPINLFGLGGLSQEAINFVIANNIANSELQQQVLSFNFSGELVQLPAGTVNFAAGWERRTEFGQFIPGAFQELGLNGDPPVPGVVGEFTTQEGFFEASIPVLDPAFASIGPLQFELTFEGAARVVNNSNSGTAVTYTAGGLFSPHPDFRFRGNFTRSIRSPSLTELFLPVSEVGTFADDPCDTDNIAAGPNPAVRQANCIAAVIASANATDTPSALAFLQGDPANPDDGFQSVIDNALQPVTVGGNPNLSNEIANSWTVGLSWTPSFIPNLQVSADYVDVTINDAIFNVDTTSLLSACFDAAAFPGSICDSVTRASNFQVVGAQTGFANIGFINFQSVTARLAYDFQVADLPLVPWDNAGGIRLNFNVQHIRQSEISILGTGEDLEILVGEASNPGVSFQSNLFYDYGKFTFLWQTLFQNSTNIDTQNSNFELPVISPFVEFNTSLSYQVNDHLSLRMVIDNIIDAEPDIQAIAGGDAAFFDPLGRRFQLGLNFSF